jgi:hypothetical protein
VGGVAFQVGGDVMVRRGRYVQRPATLALLYCFISLDTFKILASTILLTLVENIYINSFIQRAY